MSDFTPDISDTLFVWTGLEQAKAGTNPYGDNIAEVYVQHLLPRKFVVRDEKEAWTQASKNLHTVLTKFCEMNSVRANVNGREIGDWMDSFEIRSKCDVLIYEEPIKPAKKGKR